MIEGEIEFYGNVQHGKGPGKKISGFYNPVMKIDRDMELLFASYAYKQGARKFVDGLAATGIRGMRISKLLKDIEMDINDASKKSCEIIKRNVEINKINANIYNDDICHLLSEKKYDYIDIDPYGGAAPFVPCIFRGARKRAFIAVTSTDVATLCGVFKKACIRKYGAIPFRGHGMKEIGLRILMGYIARNAASNGFSFIPVISYHQQHFFRVYAIVEKGLKKADESVKKIGWYEWQNGWKVKRFEEVEGSAGPLWIGELHFNHALKEMMEHIEELPLEEKSRVKKLFQIFIQEEINIPYYNSSIIYSEMGTKQRKIEDIIGLLSKEHRACRTHFSGDGFKTDAEYDKIKKIIS